MRKIIYGIVAAAALLLLGFMMLSERVVDASRGKKLNEISLEVREKTVRLEEMKKELEKLEKAKDVKDLQATEELVAVSLDPELYTELYPVMKKHGRVGVMALSPQEFPGNEGKITKEQFDELTKAGWTACAVWNGVEPLDVFRKEIEERFKELGLKMPETIYVSVGEELAELADAVEELEQESSAGAEGVTAAATETEPETESETEPEIDIDELVGPPERYINYSVVGPVESFIRAEDLTEIIGYDPYAPEATPTDAEFLQAAEAERLKRAEERRNAAIRAAEEKGMADWRSARAAAEARRAEAARERAARARAAAEATAPSESDNAEARAQEKLDSLKQAADRLKKITDDEIAAAGFRVMIGLSNAEDKQELYRPTGKTWYPLSVPWNHKGVKGYVDQVVQENGNIVLIVGFGGGSYGYKADAFERMMKSMDDYGDRLKFTSFGDALQIHGLSEAELTASKAYEERRKELEPEIAALEEEIRNIYDGYYGR